MDLNENTVYNPYSNITTVSSLRPKKAAIAERIQFYTDEDAERVLTELNEIQRRGHANSLVDLNDLTIAHIARMIEARIEGAQNLCDMCLAVFRENEKVHRAFTSSNSRIACQSTFEICRIADHILKLEILKGQFSSDQIHFTILSSLNIDDLYLQSFNNNHDIDHKNNLIQNIITDYIRIKGNHIAKTLTLAEHEKYMRQTLGRLVINYHQ